MNEEMKNQTEQLPLLKVHMMGSFFLEYGDQPISFRKTMATKSMRLLQIFLYNKDNGISRGRLLESTYGREDVADAANSLRVGVHRLKRSLVEAGLPQFEYIYTQKGVYHWTSPMPVEVDAIERLEIQEGTALIYPLCSMGAHVSVCPNHTVGRVTPFTTRGHVALAGTFGYELDITKLPEEERKLIPEQTAMYHKYHELIREGEYYRILSSRENHRSDCWAVASEDKSEVLVTYVQVLAQANMPSRKVRLRGFDPAKKYRLEGTDEVYSGEMLMNAGFRMKDFWGDFVSRLYHFVAVD